MINKNLKNKTGRIAITQIVILVVAIFAFAWFVGSSARIVSAADENETTDTTDTETPTEEESEENNEEILDSAADVAIVTETSKKLLKKNSGKWFSKFWNPTTAVGTIASGVVWATAVAGIISFTAKYYASDRNAQDIRTTAWIGAGAGVAVVAIAVAFGATGPVGWIAGAVVALFYGVYMLVGYQIYSRETFTYYPKVWQPKSGENNCDACNSLKYENGENMCSEYLCHSYGPACNWTNEGTDYEVCFENKDEEGAPPVVEAIDTAYGQNIFPDETNYHYEFSDAGAEIVYEGSDDGCVPHYKSITLAVGTNEIANCRLALEGYTGFDYELRFSQMMDMAESSVNTIEHTLSLPNAITASESALANAGIILTEGLNYDFYIRCQDTHGNINQQDYILSFCVQEGPDRTPPEIEGSKPPQDSYIKRGTVNQSVEIYTDEPADCKWDFERKSYEAMDYTFDDCSQSINNPIVGIGTFGCKGTFTGFKDGVVNKYYITCLDQPELGENESDRNEMDAYEYRLIGTNTLAIDEVKVNNENNGTLIRDSRNTINVELKVKTAGGAEDGKARCRYSPNGVNYALFSNGGSINYLVTNTQNLYLAEGNYTYYIICEDVAHNVANTSVQFEIQTDDDAPEVVRWFRDGDSLRILTNEKAKCVYQTFTKVTTNPCIYDFDLDGIPFTSEFGEYGTSHYADWPENSQSTYYVKCEDEFGNPPPTEGCTTIVRPFEIPGLKN